jgi:hypothetical protein
MEVIAPVHMTYTPQVNDYVVWKDIEGWVYFTCDEYITIEVGTKPKHDGLSKHKKDHILVFHYTLFTFVSIDSLYQLEGPFHSVLVLLGCVCLL